MFRDVFFALWFFLPAAVANMIPIFVAKWPYVRNWNAPIDCGLTFRGKRVLGSHKTWRGLAAGIILATLALWLQQLAVEHIHWVQIWTDHVPYATLPTLILGPLFAIGALAVCFSVFFHTERA
jgi:hypothetical protein